MRRIYFLIPSVESARRIVSELLLSHVGERHIHIVARKGTVLEDLPEAKLARSSDLTPSIEAWRPGHLRGDCRPACRYVPLAGLVLGGGALLGLTLFGAGSGVWMSCMAGAGLPNSHLEKFEKAVSPGELLMIDVPRNRFEEIKELAKRHHPEAELEWVDSDISLRSNPT